MKYRTFHVALAEIWRFSAHFSDKVPKNRRHRIFRKNGVTSSNTLQPVAKV